MSYAAELSRSDPTSDLYNPDAKTPIQTQIEKTLGNIDELDKKYGANSSTSATTPAASGGTPDLSGEREAALKAISDGAPEDAVRKRFKEQNGVDL